MTTDRGSARSRHRFAASGVWRAGLVCVALLPAPSAVANDVEPRLFNNVPIGTTFLSLSLSTSEGDVTADSSIPVADVEGEVDTVLVSYSRGLDLAGRSALLTVAVPYAYAHFDGLYLGQPASADRQGLGDPRVRLAVNFHGAPALSRETFADYRQRTIIGASLEVSAPVGRYLEDRLINIGSNRWGFFAQAGFSHRMERWTIEGALGTIWFTDNDEVLGSGTLEQEPIATFRGSVRYHFRPSLWLGAGLLYTSGGSTTLNGDERDDEQDNWRTGIAVSLPLAPRHQVQLFATEGVSARIGADFTTYRITYTFTYR